MKFVVFCLNEEWVNPPKEIELVIAITLYRTE